MKKYNYFDDEVEYENAPDNSSDEEEASVGVKNKLKSFLIS